MLAHYSAVAFALRRPPFQGHLNSGRGPLAMAGQASSWLHLDNGLVSLGAMWKPRPSSLIHGRWNEQESKILPRDIVAVRLRADPALHSREWGQALYFSPSCFTVAWRKMVSSDCRWACHDPVSRRPTKTVVQFLVFRSESRMPLVEPHLPLLFISLSPLLHGLLKHP